MAEDDIILCEERKKEVEEKLQLLEKTDPDHPQIISWRTEIQDLANQIDRDRNNIEQWRQQLND